jgi:Zn-dependent M28 family amino/carboxypeptidase
LGLLFVTGCKEDKTKVKTEDKNKLEAFIAPAFSADSTYNYIEKQLSFGYRVPGTKEHEECKDWLVSKLKEYTPTVEVQEFKANFLGVKNAQSYNIIATFNPGAEKRILLAAHWDSRLIAEKDADPKMKNKPIFGADDGASGTAALLELARIMKNKPLSYIGIDIILFDAEDQGTPNGATDSWCLGSQYWGQNPHKPGYFASYGVLLDMIGAKDAHFGYEGISANNALTQLKKIWNLAHNLGYNDLFTEENTETIVDDHYYVMKFRGFPMVDIINRPVVNDEEGKKTIDFGHYHHTHKDNISVIDKEVLSKVGTVMSQLIYREDNGKI